jgi:hypothetical protein
MRGTGHDDFLMCLTIGTAGLDKPRIVAVLFIALRVLDTDMLAGDLHPA